MRVRSRNRRGNRLNHRRGRVRGDTPLGSHRRRTSIFRISRKTGRRGNRRQPTNRRQYGKRNGGKVCHQASQRGPNRRRRNRSKNRQTLTRPRGGITKGNRLRGNHSHTARGRRNPRFPRLRRRIISRRSRARQRK